MCGIAGFVGAGSRLDLARMAAALAHRGPDSDGFFVDEAMHVFLSHRRLSIIDPASGHQPMWNEDRQVGVIFNGEIYNHAELRSELERCGHRFASDHSDTEVLVHGWEEWFEGLPARINGMFAFAIIDRVQRRLFLARDRFGEKPLYYAARPGFFAFASELTALAEHPAISRSIAPRALQKFFAYGYIPAPNAILKGTSKLPGGHWLRYDIASGEHVVKPYWRFILEPDPSLGDADEPRLVDECRALNLSSAAAFRRKGSYLVRNEDGKGWEGCATKLDLEQPMLAPLSTGQPFGLEERNDDAVKFPAGLKRPILAVPAADPVRCFALSLYGPHAVGTDLDSNERTMLFRLANFAAAMYAELEAIELRHQITLLKRKLKAPSQRV